MQSSECSSRLTVWRAGLCMFTLSRGDHENPATRVEQPATLLTHFGLERKMLCMRKYYMNIGFLCKLLARKQRAKKSVSATTIERWCRIICVDNLCDSWPACGIRKETRAAGLGGRRGAIRFRSLAFVRLRRWPEIARKMRSADAMGRFTIEVNLLWFMVVSGWWWQISHDCCTLVMILMIGNKNWWFGMKFDDFWLILTSNNCQNNDLWVW